MSGVKLIRLILFDGLPGTGKAWAGIHAAYTVAVSRWKNGAMPNVTVCSKR